MGIRFQKGCELFCVGDRCSSVYSQYHHRHPLRKCRWVSWNRIGVRAWGPYERFERHIEWRRQLISCLLVCSLPFSLFPAILTAADVGQDYPWLLSEEHREYVEALIFSQELPPPNPQMWQAGPYCGINCVFSLLAIDGKAVSHRDLLENHGPADERGLNLLQLQELLRQHGLVYEVREVSANELGKLPFPYIARLKQAAAADDFHFVVVLRLDRDRPTGPMYQLIDGTQCAEVEVSSSDLHREFTGFVLVQSDAIHQAMQRATTLAKFIVALQMIGLIAAIVWIGKRHIRQRETRSL